MNNRKINLDRPKISSEEIKSRQSFDEVLANLKVLKKPFYKKTWFWGTTGLATAALAIGLSTTVNNENRIDEEKTTLATTNQAPLTNQEFKDTPCITPPVEGKDLEFENYTVMPGRDTTIITANGSKISFEESTLKTTDKNTPVDIKVRYFGSKAEAFVAGIPMTYKDQAFESAGMIEIRGEQNGEVVEINPEKAVKVEMKMYKPKDGFNFYALNDENGEWEDSECIYSEDKGGVDNTNKKNTNSNEKGAENATSNSVNVEPSSPQELEKKIVEVKQEIAKIEEPKRADYKLTENKDLVFDLDYDVREFPEFKALKGVGFEALPNQEVYGEIVREEWDDFSLQLKGDQYIITFEKGFKKKSLKARPVLSGKDEKNAEELYKQVQEDVKSRKIELEEELKALEKRRKDAQERLEKALIKSAQEREAKLLEYKRKQEERKYLTNASALIQTSTASFSTVRWGVFNCDNPKAFPKPAALALNYYAGNRLFRPTKAYVFNHKKDARYDYFFNSQGTQSLQNIGFGNGENVLFMINKKGDLGYVKFNGKVVNAKRNHNFKLTLIQPKQLNVGFIKSLLGEDEITEDADLVAVY